MNIVSQNVKKLHTRNFAVINFLRRDGCEASTSVALFKLACMALFDLAIVVLCGLIMVLYGLLWDKRISSFLAVIDLNSKSTNK